MTNILKIYFVVKKATFFFVRDCTFHLEDFYNSSNKSRCFHGISFLHFSLNSIKISQSMFLPGSHSVRLHFTFSVFSFGISRHLTFASVSPSYEDLNNFGGTGANAAGI